MIDFLFSPAGGAVLYAGVFASLTVTSVLCLLVMLASGYRLWGTLAGVLFLLAVLTIGFFARATDWDGLPLETINASFRVLFLIFGIVSLNISVYCIAWMYRHRRRTVA